MRTLTRQNGFTLLEMAVVIFVSGLLTVAAAKLYSLYLSERSYTITKDNMRAAGIQMSYFFEKNYGYPCPADRALAPTDPGYGLQFDSDCNPGDVGLTAVGMCTAGGGLCMAAGMRDMNGDGDMTDPDEVVLIGALPVRSFSAVTPVIFSENIVKDGWDNKFTYAVTAALTNGSYEYYKGTVHVQDEFGNETAGIQNNGHYVIVSHGPDGKGAFTVKGDRPVPCGPVAAALDNENCDDDGLFVQALGEYRAGTGGYFDDRVSVVRAQSNELWDFMADATGNKMQHIYSLVPGDVGVGTDLPSQKLEVDGSLRAESNNTASPAGPYRNAVRVSKICEYANPGRCFDITAITNPTAGAPIGCPSAQVMTGISNVNETCVVPTFSSGLIPGQSCGTGYIKGIRTDGSVICSGP